MRIFQKLRNGAKYYLHLLLLPCTNNQDNMCHMYFLQAYNTCCLVNKIMFVYMKLWEQEDTSYS